MDMKMDDMWNFSWVVYGSTSHYKGDYVNYLVRGRDKIWSDWGMNTFLIFHGERVGATNRVSQPVPNHARFRFSPGEFPQRGTDVQF